MTALTKFYPKKTQIKQKNLLNRANGETEEQEEETEEYVDQVFERTKKKGGMSTGRDNLAFRI